MYQMEEAIYLHLFICH